MSRSTKENNIVDICQNIDKAFDDDANISLDTIYIDFNDENGDSLDSYEYDVNNDELN